MEVRILCAGSHMDICMRRRHRCVGPANSGVASVALTVTLVVLAQLQYSSCNYVRAAGGDRPQQTITSAPSTPFMRILQSLPLPDTVNGVPTLTVDTRGAFAYATNETGMLFQLAIGASLSVVQQLQLPSERIYYSFMDVQEASGVQSLYLGTADSTLVQVDVGAGLALRTVTDLTQYGVSRGDLGGYALQQDTAHTLYLTANYSVVVLQLMAPDGTPCYVRTIASFAPQMPWCALVQNTSLYVGSADEVAGTFAAALHRVDLTDPTAPIETRAIANASQPFILVPQQSNDTSPTRLVCLTKQALLAVSGTLDPLQRYDTDCALHELACVSRDGRAVLAACSGHWMRWDTASLQPVDRAAVPTRGALSCAALPAGGWLMSGDGAVVLAA